jgi:hypothetical protein
MTFTRIYDGNPAKTNPYLVVLKGRQSIAFGLPFARMVSGVLKGDASGQGGRNVYQRPILSPPEIDAPRTSIEGALEAQSRGRRHSIYRLPFPLHGFLYIQNLFSNVFLNLKGQIQA